MILQGKGGVEKSFIAATVAQYKASKGQRPPCIHTDPVNSTFHGYKALNVGLLQIIDGDEINSRKIRCSGRARCRFGMAHQPNMGRV
jgi:anion-transporting  ArsA/GET3 family ATPase